MKSKRILLTGVAVIIAAAGVFAGMKKSVTAVYFKTAGLLHCSAFLNSNTTGLFTATGGSSGVQASTKTTGGTTVNLFSTSTCSSSHKVYLLN